MTPQVAADFKAMGVTPPEINTGDVSEPVFDVWEENWTALCAFLSCETQWRTIATLGGVFRQGLDYGAVDIVLRRHNLDDAVFADLQMMEHAALEAFGECD